MLACFGVARSADCKLLRGLIFAQEVVAMSDPGKSSMAARRRWLGGRTLGVLGLTAALLSGAGMVRHAAADPLDDSATFNDPHSTDPNDPGNRAAIQTHVIQL